MLRLLFALLLTVATARAELRVATLHPLLNDLARGVGGAAITVVPLFPEGGDPHTFNPTPATLAQASTCQLVLASGKGLETYLDRLADNLPAGVQIIETGKKVPSLTVEVGELFVCCPNHNHGSLDPHWWHSPSAVARAARYLARDFSEIDPGNAAAYKKNAKAFGKRMKELERWAKKELAFIPKKDRELATAHAAFGYFCRDFGFRAIPVQGLGKERDPTPDYLATTLSTLRDNDVRAVFPETLANPKTLAALAREVGVKLGGTLDADVTTPGATYESVMRKNVAAIAAAFR